MRKVWENSRPFRYELNQIPSDYALDYEFLIAKFRLKLKKVGKTTRPFWDDLNQIPFDYTVEVTSRFKGLIW